MKLQLKRSNVLELGGAKEPTAPQMEYGELAVNYNTSDPAIFLKDSNDNIIRIAGTGNINSGDNPSGDTLPPTGNEIGDMFFNTTNNTMYYWDGSEWVPIANDVTAADIFVGTYAEINAEVPEDERRNGFLWWNVEDGTLYIWYIDANTSQFVIAIPSTGGGGSGANVAVLDTPPTDPEQGDMWWNTNDGRLYIWYQDVDSGQWVDASPDSQVSPITSGPTFPADALENDCFFNTTDGRLYIYYDDGTSLQWVDASPDSQGAVYWNRVNGELVPTSDTDNVNIGDGNITLNANGSASFASTVALLPLANTTAVQANILSFNSGGASPALYSTGTAYSQGSPSADYSSPSGITLVNKYDINIACTGVSQDGKINFFTSPASGSSGSAFAARFSKGNFELGPTKGAPNITLNADGSAEFAGTVKAKNFEANSTLDSGTYCKIVANGFSTGPSAPYGATIVMKSSGTSLSSQANSYINVANDANNIFAVRGDGGVVVGGTIVDNRAQSPNILLAADGSATFVGTVTATVVPPSDARFKENIAPAKPQLADVVALGGLLKNYDWNDQAPLNEEIRSQRQLGLIAQEVAEVCPAIVKDIKRTKTVEVKPAVTGPKGRVITEAITEELDDSYKGISQDALIMKLIGAVAELSAEVQSLKEGN